MSLLIIQKKIKRPQRSAASCLVFLQYNFLQAVLLSYELEKLPTYGRLFSSFCGRLQPSAATVGPFGPSILFFWREKFLAKFFLSNKNSGEIFFLWQLAGGSWQVVVGRWHSAVGRWKLAVGRCKLAGGMWQVEVGMWSNCLGAVRKAGIRCPPPAGSGGGNL